MPRGLELRVPPPVVAVLAMVLMWLGAWIVPQFALVIPGRRVVAAGIALAGVVVAILGVVSFRRAKTTVNPMRPDTSSSLVVTGIYRLTRNPMYLGFLLILIGWAIYLSNALAFALPPGFVLYITLFQIRPEERALSSLFGTDFAAYMTKVRRWI